jgi:hypothetical protein
MARAPVYDPKDQEPVTGPDLEQLEESPQTPAELLERIPTMSAKEGAEHDKHRGFSDTAKHLKKSEEPHGGGTSDSLYRKKDASHRSAEVMAEQTWVRRWILGKRGAVGGGVLGLLIGGLIWGFSILQGPFQFIHLAQSLAQFHLASQEDQADNRFSKMVRLIATRGDARETRVGALSSSYAGKIESKIKATGIQPDYQGVFKNFSGFVIDPNDEAAKRNFGDTPQKMKDYWEGKGVTLIDGDTMAGRPDLKGKLYAEGGGRFAGQSRVLVRRMLGEAGYSKIGSVVPARVFGKYGGVDWHPIRREFNRKSNETLTKMFERMKKSNEEELSKGAGALAPEDKSPEVPADENGDTAAQKNEKLKARDRLKDARAGVNDFLAGKTGTALGGGALGVGVACIIYSLDKQAGEIKYAQVVLPTMREGMKFVTLGHQVMNGEDVDQDQLSFYSQQFYGKDANGKKTSWTQARSIQAEEGQAQTGTDADETLKTINKGSPFSGINDVPGIKTVCSTGGQIVAGILGFGINVLSGDFFALASGVGQYFALGPVLDQAAKWLAGNAVSKFPVGADLGNEANFGVRLFANGQAVSHGGRKLSANEETQMKTLAAADAKVQFESHGIAYRLFSPEDRSSAVAKLIDNSSPSFSDNVGKLAYGFLSFSNSLASLSNIFGGAVHAATPAPYDYGFPAYGFSVEEMNDPNFANPYQNAQAAAQILNTNGSNYIDRVQKCFGVTLSKDSGVWDAQHTDVPDPYDSNNTGYDKHGCDDNSDMNWKKIRFFIFDTDTMKGVTCFEGDDQSCQDEGLVSADQGSSGPVDCNAGGFQPGDWNSVPAAFKAAIEAHAPNRSHPGVCGSYPNAHPSDPNKEFFGQFAYTDGKAALCTGADLGPQGGSQYPGHMCIGVKYRNPPDSGDTRVIPID